jgi:predicted NBD/HSP70 family sugar kinase
MRVLAVLGQLGPLSRTDLARRLDLSPATVTQVTRRLIADGLVEELERTPSRGGRPAQLLGLTGEPGRAIGVQIAADHAVGVEVRLDGALLQEREIPLDAAAPDCLDTVAALVAALVSRGSRLLDSRPLGWTSMPVGPRLRAALDLPVLVDNDVNALAVAERLYGRGRGRDDLIVVTIGRGVGLAVVANGGLVRGATGGAGEFGHMPVAEGPRCGCGNLGCLEAVVGAASLRARTRQMEPATVYAEAGAVLGRAVAGLVNLLDPAAVLVLGEATRQWDRWRPGFDASFPAHLTRPTRHIPVEVGAWEDSRWAQGAAALVLGTPLGIVPGVGEQAEPIRALLG